MLPFPLETLFWPPQLLLKFDLHPSDIKPDFLFEEIKPDIGAPKLWKQIVFPRGGFENCFD